MPQVAMPQLTMNAWLRLDAIRRNLRIARPTTVLEIGAGEGGLGAWLAAHYDYTGVEVDACARETAVARVGGAGSGRVVGDLATVDGRRFDLACAFEVLEHIGDDRAALRAWHEHIRSLGWIMLSVPAHQRQFGAADRLAGHHRRYERAELRARLDEAGFTIARLTTHGAGLGQMLEQGRNLVAGRASRGEPADTTPEERTSASGRWFQPKSRATAAAFAAVAAPGRLLQTPFARTDVGTGYVVLARRIT